MGTHAYSDSTPADETQDVLDSIRRIFRALRESSRRSESELGLSGAQLFVLQVLLRSGPLSMSEVAARTRTHQSSVSVVVQRLVDHELATRERSEQDGRRQVVALSTRGRRIATRSFDPAQVRLIAAVAALPASRRKDLAISLREVVAAMSLADAPPEMFDEPSPPSPPPENHE